MATGWDNLFNEDDEDAQAEEEEKEVSVLLTTQFTVSYWR